MSTMYETKCFFYSIAQTNVEFPDFIENGDCMCFYIIIRIWLAFTWFFNGGRYIVCTCSESRFWTEKYFCAFFLVCVCKHRHYPFPNIWFCMSRRWDAISFIGSLCSLVSLIYFIFFFSLIRFYVFSRNDFLSHRIGYLLTYLSLSDFISTVCTSATIHVVWS